MNPIVRVPYPPWFVEWKLKFGTESCHDRFISLHYEHSAERARTSLEICWAGVSGPHPTSPPSICAGPVAFRPFLTSFLPRTLSVTSLCTTFLCFSRASWSILIFPAASQLKLVHTLFGMNPISIGTRTAPQHIGTSQELLRTIQSFLLQQKLTQESLGHLAQPWFARAEAPAQSAWLRRWSSCFLPQLVLVCLALLCLPSLSVPRIALFQSAPIPSVPGRCYSHPPWGPQEPPFIVSLSCAVSWARHFISLFRSMQIPGFLHFTEEPMGSSGGWGDLPRVTQLVDTAPGASTCPPNPKSIYSTPRPGFSTTSGIIHVITFQELLSKSLGAIWVITFRINLISQMKLLWHTFLSQTKHFHWKCPV